MEESYEVFSITTEDGDEMEVAVVDSFEKYGNEYYAVMPLNEDGDLDEDAELIVGVMETDEDGDQYFGEIEDDDEFDEINQLFIDRLEEELEDLEDSEDDEEEDEDAEEVEYEILTITDEAGDEVQTAVVDTLRKYGNEYYAVMALDENGELPEEDGELIVGMMITEDNGDQYFTEIEDDDEYEEISQIFIDRLEEELDEE